MKNSFSRYYFFLLAIGFSFTLLGQTVTAKSCLDCHKKINTKTFIHEPSRESCKTCHQSTGKKHPSDDDEEGFKLTEKIPGLCYSCHDPLNTNKNLHMPVKEGDCLSCHEVHSSNAKKLVFAPTPELCYFCHSDLEKRIDTLSFNHGIVKTGSACLNCHSPHQAMEPKLLITKERDLCLQCHDKSISKEQKGISNIKSELDKNKFTHTAILKNGCSGCHDPHVSAQNGLLKGKFSAEIYVSAKTKDNVALCFQCHDSKLLEKDKTTEATSFRDGEKNLHFKHVNKRKGRNCVNCHGIHSAPNEFLLLDKSRFGDWEMPLVFTKTETGGKCITACHAAKSYSRGSNK